jgi:hypothetical protein
MLFIEKALSVLVDGGFLGFSVSNSFIRTVGGDRIRRIIAQLSRVIEIVEFEDKQVYPEAVTQIALLSLAKSGVLDRSRHVIVKGVGGVRPKLDSIFRGGVEMPSNIAVHTMPSYAFNWPDWHLLPDKDAGWLAHIHFVGRPLEYFLVGLGQGLNTGADDVFLLREVARTFKRVVFGKSRVNGKTYRLEGDVTRAIIRGRHVKGYQIPESHDLCILPYDSEGRVLSEDGLQRNFPNAYHYLMDCRSRLAERPMKIGVPWYAASRRLPDLYRFNPKLVSSKISSRGGFTLIDNPNVAFHNSVVVLVPNPAKVDPHCLLGILNSSVFWRFIRLTTPFMGCGRQVLRLSDVRRFPVPKQMTEEQRGLCEMIADLARQTMRRGNLRIPQDEIDALAGRLFEVGD